MNIEVLSPDQKLIPKPSLCQALGMTRSGLDKLLKKDPTFPKPLKFSDSKQAACYFPANEVNDWLKARLAERGGAA